MSFLRLSPINDILLYPGRAIVSLRRSLRVASVSLVISSLVFLVPSGVMGNEYTDEEEEDIPASSVSPSNFFDSIFSPTATKIRSLIKEQKFTEAISFLIDKQSRLSRRDLEALTAQLRDKFTAEYDNKLVKPISRIDLGNDYDTLKKQFSQISEFISYDDSVNSRKVFFSVKDAPLERLISDWFISVFELLGKKPTLYSSFAALEGIKNSYSDASKQCFSFLKQNINRGMVSFCYELLHEGSNYFSEELSWEQIKKPDGTNSGRGFKGKFLINLEKKWFVPSSA